MGNAIVFVILAIIIGAAVAYIIKAKKRGVRCIGCSAGGSCACGSVSENAASCGCGCSGCGQNADSGI